MPRLNNGQRLPTMTLPKVGGGTISLPDELAGGYSAVLIYRGAWCPVCNAQLAGFAEQRDALDKLGVRVVAFSVDDEATTAALANKHGIEFMMGHSADAAEVVAKTDAYTNDEPRYLQPTAFVLGPDGSILSATYSSNAVGRVSGSDVVGMVTYLTSKAT